MSTMSRKVLTLLTYNIDGLNGYELVARTTEIIGLILSADADVIQLQELVQETAPVIANCLKGNGYQVCGTTNGSSVKFNDLGSYFTLTFVRSSLANDIKIKRAPFANGGESFQGRDLLQTVFQFNGVEIMSINLHCESTGQAFKSPESFIRTDQLDQAMRALVSHNGPGFIAGDLNIRDTEAISVLNKHNNALKKPNLRKIIISDAAEYLHPKGTTKGDKSCNTWNMPDRTTGRTMECRFDRVYFPSNIAGFKALQMKLIGDEKIFPQSEFTNWQETGCTYLTPSDHRGLVVVFEVEGPGNNDPKKVTYTSSFSDNVNISKLIKSSNLYVSSVFSSKSQPFSVGSGTNTADTYSSVNSVTTNSTNSNTNTSSNSKNNNKRQFEVVDLCGDTSPEVKRNKTNSTSNSTSSTGSTSNKNNSAVLVIDSDDETEIKNNTNIISTNSNSSNNNSSSNSSNSNKNNTSNTQTIETVNISTVSSAAAADKRRLFLEALEKRQKETGV